MKKITECLIEQIVDLKIKLNKTETFYSKEEKDYSALLQPIGTKQSAVEWLIETHFGSIENCTPDFRNKIKQAKEMEEQQQGYSEEELEVAFFEGRENNLPFTEWFKQFKKK